MQKRNAERLLVTWLGGSVRPVSFGEESLEDETIFTMIGPSTSNPLLRFGAPLASLVTTAQNEEQSLVSHAIVRRESHKKIMLGLHSVRAKTAVLAPNGKIASEWLDWH